MSGRAEGGAPIPARRLAGYLIEFETPEQILRAASRVRENGYRRWDTTEWTSRWGSGAPCFPGS
jgi:hypothetical protein